ncbi:TPA: hypothetical protein DEO28_01760 [Candidatus Dependentiae bacterium]|nr:MAG: hypothetical protein UR14_C0004G0042 [candidate division TM6 bacterium GW2011_GWE2_31_21]KKP52960.1 MAG: hypothetical protein UR43_C0008G0042 [candidate division TM6 bacterium GW2011_GWF2_33_332]HBS47802.1 hypothetical protein [Candidatus Dependentiae bacterium]HBZ73222.1 hypothetical protein [Candidatus Dependentiae bacterium]
MKIIFCCNPIDQKSSDPIYEAEYNVAKKLGLDVFLINIEELIYFNNIVKAIKNIPSQETLMTALYRGWMLTPEKYSSLYDALISKNIKLINSPQSYIHCHYLPENYEIIKDLTAKTIWFTKQQLDENRDMIFEELKTTFRSSPIIIKDYVKSRKHEWLDACYIPNASDENEVTRVLNNFLKRQGNELNKGVVFREFLKLSFLSFHPKSNMPLTKEFRIFFLNGKLLATMYYWDEGDYSETWPNFEQFVDLASKIQSSFFTIDIAQTESGEWKIIEIGDGQVSGLPENANLNEFYSKIKEKVL